MTDSARTASPWYREPMMWLVAGIPAVMVTASLVLVAISVHVGADEALPVDVRRTAQIVEDLRADRAAIALGMRHAVHRSGDRVGRRRHRSAAGIRGTVAAGADPPQPGGVIAIWLARSGERFGRVPLPLPAV